VTAGHFLKQFDLFLCSFYANGIVARGTILVAFVRGDVGMGLFT
jgi:hypothetical protein